MDTTTMFDQTLHDQMFGRFEVWEPEPPDPGWPPGPLPFDPLWQDSASDSLSGQDADSVSPSGNDGGGPDDGGGGGAGAHGAFRRSVFCADPSAPAIRRQALAAALPEGFTGSLGLRGVPALGQDSTGSALQGLQLLEGWAAAAKARLVHRQHLLMIERLEQDYRDLAAQLAEDAADAQEAEDAADAQEAEDAEMAAGRETGRTAERDPGRSSRRGARARPGADRAMAFSLTATEIATLFRIPEGTAMALVEESDELCTRCPETLERLEAGAITLAQARTILDQTRPLVNPAPVGGAAPDPGDAGADTQTAGMPDKGGDVPEDTEEGGAGPESGHQPEGVEVPLFPPGAAAALEQELLALAPELTNAKLIRKARRLRERSYPQSIPVRHRIAFEERRVWFQPQPDGMGHLTAYLPATKGQQIYGALTGAARGEQAQGDPRGLDQLRTDILASLLLHTPEPWIGPANQPSTDRDGGNANANGNAEEGDGESGEDGDLPLLPAGTVAEIMVLISADTLFGADDAPAELAGYGPITAEAARRLARAACRWTGLVQDPGSGQVLGVGRRRKVPAGLRRWLQARDQTCRFPGCSTGTARTEADHTIPWAAGGPTEHGNLANLCKKHHLFKTLGYWTARQVSPGVLEWVSPLGRHYSTQPELTLAPRNQLPDAVAAAGTTGSPDTAVDDSGSVIKRAPLSAMFWTGPDPEGSEPAPF